MAGAATRRRSTRLPPRRGSALIHIGHLAKTLDRPTAWIRRVDDILKPLILADGTRAYHLERAWMFVAIYDGPETCRAAYEAYWRECDERATSARRRDAATAVER